MKLLVESISAGRDEQGKVRLEITYRFGPPAEGQGVAGEEREVAEKHRKNIDALSNSLEFDNPLAPLVSVVLGLVAGELLRHRRRPRTLRGWAGAALLEGREPGEPGLSDHEPALLRRPVDHPGFAAGRAHGDYRVLALKSALDFVAALSFASVLGWGVLLSAGTVLVVQGALTLSAGLLEQVLTKTMILATTATGGVLILGLGLILLDLKEVRVAKHAPGAPRGAPAGCPGAPAAVLGKLGRVTELLERSGMSEEARRNESWEGSPLQMESGLDPHGIAEIVVEFDTGDEEVIVPKMREEYGSYELMQAATYLDTLSHQLRVHRK